MTTNRYGVTYARDWGLLILVACIGVACGALGAYLATGKLAERFAGDLRRCEAALDAKEKR